MTNPLTLTEAETQAIRDLSRSVGQAPEAILHAAIEQFLAQHQTRNRLQSLRAARGIWSEREDTPDARELRGEWDRNF